MTLPQADLVLPAELLIEIALKSPSTFYAMATSIPFVGRYSMRMQETLKAHFIVKRHYRMYQYDDGKPINELNTILPNGWRHSVNDEPAITNELGYECWCQNGKLHRDNDLPAVILPNIQTGNNLPLKFFANIFANGEHEQLWYQTGNLYHDNALPVVINANGEQNWYQNGKLHRDNDLPAIICANGEQHWYQNGKRHRDNDLPAAIYPDGEQYWYQNGKLHRDNDLPAVILQDGTQNWFQNGKLHRDNDLPAIIYADGQQLWYRDGIKYTSAT